MACQETEPTEDAKPEVGPQSLDGLPEPKLQDEENHIKSGHQGVSTLRFFKT